MSWQNEWRNGFRTAEQLAPILGWTPEETARYSEVIRRYPMLIPPYDLSLVDPTNPEDPIARMCVPSLAELEAGGSQDTSGEADNTKIEGLQHKYAQTALLLSTNQCAMYCRHCFRKRMVGLSDAELNKRVDEAVAYVSEHREINNVLVSGGDAFGSRVPVTLPERIYGDEEFLDLFEKYGKRKALFLVTHFNHPRELTEQAARAIRAMIERGVPVRNQTVLTRGVNDSGEILAALLSGLTRLGVMPYYIFQCRPVTGVKGRFQVPLANGLRIVDEAKSRLNGIGKAVRYAMSHPRGKIEVVCRMPDGETLFKFHQSKYAEDSARPFSVRLSPTDTWLDKELQGV